MALIDDVKISLRMATNVFDSELTGIIEAAKADLKLTGVLDSKITTTEMDPLLKRAVILYTKSHFGLDNSDSEKYQAAYDALKVHLCLSQEYTTERTV